MRTFPKIERKKQRTKKEKCLFALGSCYGCGISQNLQIHHIFPAANRHLSDQYGLYVNLCLYCHQDVTDNKDVKLVMELKQEAQERFEGLHGHDKFMRTFGKNYL